MIDSESIGASTITAISTEGGVKGMEGIEGTGTGSASGTGETPKKKKKSKSKKK